MGISPDQVDRQRTFDEQNSLGFPLLSDPRRSVSRAFRTKRPGLFPNKRRTFVIDTDRRVLGVIASETNMDTHADTALEILRARS